MSPECLLGKIIIRGGWRFTETRNHVPLGRIRLAGRYVRRGLLKLVPKHVYQDLYAFSYINEYVHSE